MSLLRCLVDFGGVPFLIYVAARTFFRRTHSLEPSAVDVVSQRFTRACMALYFVSGAARLLSDAGFRSSLLEASEASSYWVQGTLVFYSFDCLLLMLYKQWQPSMWAHHAAALALFSFAHISHKGHSGCMLALLAEMLVPFGFSLFYLRAIGVTQSPLFRAVCWGGMATLVLRALLWSAVMYEHNVRSDNWSRLPAVFSLLVNGALFTGFCLEYTWFGLYYRNYRRSLEGAMGRRTPSMLNM